MGGTRGRIDSTEFVPASAITKLVCFLVISIIVVYFARTRDAHEYSVMMGAMMYIMGTIFGVIGGFIGVYLGRVIQEYVGPVSVYEKEIGDVFIRKISMKIGPGLLGCGIGSFAGAYGFVFIFY